MQMSEAQPSEAKATIPIIDEQMGSFEVHDVTRVEPVDLSPISFKEIQKQNRKLRFKTSLLLTPKMDEESKQLLILDEPEIGLYVFAYTRDELIHEANE